MFAFGKEASTSNRPAKNGQEPPALRISDIGTHKILPVVSDFRLWYNDRNNTMIKEQKHMNIKRYRFCWSPQ